MHKHTIIESSFFNGIDFLHMTYHYFDGKRVSKNSASVYEHFWRKNKEYDHTDSYSNENGNGCKRDYTVIWYRDKM